MHENACVELSSDLTAQSQWVSDCQTHWIYNLNPNFLHSKISSVSTLPFYYTSHQIVSFASAMNSAREC